MTALTYAGLMSAGPFFVSRKDVGLGNPSLVLDVDKMACYVAEKVYFEVLGMLVGDSYSTTHHFEVLGTLLGDYHLPQKYLV